MAEARKAARGIGLEAYDDLVHRLVKCLANSGLDYAFTGALAVSFYGSPRTTSDVDVMVAVGVRSDTKARIMGALDCASIENKLTINGKT